MVNSTHGAFWEVFKNWGLILISWNSPVFACNQLINISDTSALEKWVFEKWGLILISWKLIFLFKGLNHYIQFSIINFNPQSSISEKWPRSEKNASPAPQKLTLEAKINFFSYQTYEPSVFCKKNALNLVKYGRHSPTYDLHPHIGGRHSVLYFTIQVFREI